MDHSQRKSLLFWLFSTAFLVWAMVMLGGATRLTHAGLSIVEWKPVTGIIPPLNEFDWQQEFQKYQQFPEFQQNHSWMSLSDFKFIFGMEYAHRLLGRLMGLVFLMPFVVFWMRGWLSPSLKKRGFLILGLGLLQGFMGWYMVKSGLVKDPQVSHYRLTAHLLLAIGILGVILESAFQLIKPSQKSIRYSKTTFLALIFTLITIVYGGFVAGLKAGWIYNTYPLMNGQFLPEDFFFLPSVFKNFVENPAAVQFIHRWLALITCGLILWAAVKSSKGSEGLKKSALVMGGLAVLQVGLGILTLLFQVPVILGTLHQGTAILLFGCVFWVLFLINRERGHVGTHLN